MKFLCLAYEDEAIFHTMPRAEWDAIRDETLSYVSELRAKGILLSAEPLQSARTAATLRFRDGKLSITDGPFAETKEQLGGFFLIQAQDMAEAREIVRRWPSTRLGTIEVRPIEDGLPVESRYPRP